MKANLEREKETERVRRRTRVLHWLGSENAIERHEQACSKRKEGTGEWLIKKQRFQQWFSPDQCIDPLLWLHGIPGAGTDLSSRIDSI